MTVLIRSMRYCLTSEGEQAVITAVISLLALNVFVDGTAAVQVIPALLLAQQPFPLSSVCDKF